MRRAHGGGADGGESVGPLISARLPKTGERPYLIIRQNSEGTRCSEGFLRFTSQELGHSFCSACVRLAHSFRPHEHDQRFVHLARSTFQKNLSGADDGMRVRKFLLSSAKPQKGASVCRTEALDRGASRCARNHSSRVGFHRAHARECPASRYQTVKRFRRNPLDHEPPAGRVETANATMTVVDDPLNFAPAHLPDNDTRY